MSAITTHVLDQSNGRPAAGMAIRLEIHQGEGMWRSLGEGQTDADGRMRALLPPDHVLAGGIYRLTFGTGAWYAERGGRCFYPEVSVAFEVLEPRQQTHVPLLLNPFGFTTYRGS